MPKETNKATGFNPWFYSKETRCKKSLHKIRTRCKLTHSIKRRYAKITILLHTIPRRLQTKIILHNQKKMQTSLCTIEVTIEIAKK
jgi:hypothetical protein